MFQFSDLPQPVLRHLNGVWRRRWIAAALAAAAALLAWFAVWLLPDKYESRAHVFVQTETILEPVLNGVVARPDYARRVEVMTLQLLTRPNVEEIILRAGIDSYLDGKTPTERRAKLESLAAWIGSEIRIESPRDMYFVISYKHGDPVVAQKVVDAVLNLLIEQDLGASLAEGEAARRRLDLQIEQFDEKLTANERAVAAFRREHAAELAASQSHTRRRELRENELLRVSDELERTKGRILTLKNLISATPGANTGDELDKLRLELAALRSQYRESHPDIRGVRARIAALQAAGAEGESVNPEYVRLQSELRVAEDSVVMLEAREGRLTTELEAFDAAVVDAPEVEAALRQIEREYEQTQRTYDELLSRRDRLQLTKSLGAAGRGVEYQVFERPQVALTPIDPPRLFLIVGSMVLALGVGVAGAFILNLMDKSYTHADELQQAFGLPVLGALSEVTSENVKLNRRKDYMRLAAAGTAFAFLGFAYAYFSVYQLPTQPLQDTVKIDSRSDRTEAL